MATGDDQRDSSPTKTRGIEWDAVARLYDTYVTATFDVPFYLREVANAGAVLELMCGTGRLSLPLAEAGASLTCVDSSSEMLAVLREKLAEHPDLATRVRIHQMDVRHLALDRQFDLALLPFQSFAELVVITDRQRALQGIHAHLRAGGRLICTLHNPAVRRASLDGQLRLVGQYPKPGRGGTLLVWALGSYDPATHLVDGMQFYEEYGADAILVRKRMLAMRFALPERGEFEVLAAGAGFRVRALYGDYDCSRFDENTSPFMIWVLDKQ